MDQGSRVGKGVAIMITLTWEPLSRGGHCLTAPRSTWSGHAVKFNLDAVRMRSILRGWSVEWRKVWTEE